MELPKVVKDPEIGGAVKGGGRFSFLVYRVCVFRVFFVIRIWYARCGGRASTYLIF